MWIVAIGWAYVVILMAATETSVIAGIMTFFGYCVLPLSILFYIAGAGKRRQRRVRASTYSTATPDGADASLLMNQGFFLPSSHHTGDGSADHGAGDCGGWDGSSDSGGDSGGGDCGGGDGGGGGGD